MKNQKTLALIAGILLVTAVSNVPTIPKAHAVMDENAASSQQEILDHEAEVEQASADAAQLGLPNLDSTITIDQAAVDGLNSKIADLQAQLDTTSSQLSDAIASGNYSQDDLTSLSDQIAELKTQLNETSSQLNSTDPNTADLQKSYDELRQKLADLEKLEQQKTSQGAKSTGSTNTPTTPTPTTSSIDKAATSSASTSSKVASSPSLASTPEIEQGTVLGVSTQRDHSKEYYDDLKAQIVELKSSTEKSQESQVDRNYFNLTIIVFAGALAFLAFFAEMRYAKTSNHGAKVSQKNTKVKSSRSLLAQLGRKKHFSSLGKKKRRK